MPEKLKLQKVNGAAIVDFGHFSVALDDCNVFTNGWDEKDLIILVQDKHDPSKKIQLTFEKPEKFVEKPASAAEKT